MAGHRRRNKVVIWEWARHDEHTEPRRDSRRRRSVARDAFGAAVLLGVIMLVLSLIPPDSDSRYRRDHIARYMCEIVGTDPATPQCVAVAIGGWWLIVIAIGIALKTGRRVLASVSIRRDES